MKSLATLEADLWLAQRAHRRNPSEENKAAIEAIEAEIASLSAESTDTSDEAQPEGLPDVIPAKLPFKAIEAKKEPKPKKENAPKKKEE